MSNIKGYLKNIIGHIVVLLFSLTVFGIIFLLSNMNMQFFWFACLFIAFFVGIYWVIKYTAYVEEVNSKVELEKNVREIQNLENQILDERRNIQEYFLLWLHQVKTPITAANLLAQDYEKEPEERIRSIRQELIRIESYSNMAMNYLKLINPVTDLEFDFVDLDEILQSLIKRYSIFFISDKTKLEYKEINKKVLSDGKWLSVLMEQILSNAVKYAKGTSVHIYFSDNSLHIRDTGIGISEVDLPKIFDKGYSGFNGRLNEKSTGLGLFLAERIAKRLNHSIEVQSRLREGSIFSIRFQEIKE